MWIQVRLMSGTKTVRVDNLSKQTKIEELRLRLEKPFDVEPERQRLFFRGKQMEDGHTLFEYDVGLNDLIQMLVRHKVDTPIKVDVNSEEKEDKVDEASPSSESGSSSDKENKEPETEPEVKTQSEETPLPAGNVYKVGDIIDARDISMGCWFEAKISKIEHGIATDVKERLAAVSASADPLAEQPGASSSASGSGTQAQGATSSSDEADKQTEKLDFGKDDGFTYHVHFEEYPEDNMKVLSTEIKPRARTLVRFEDVTVGQHIMANYNYEDPGQRGFYYDCIVKDKKDTRTKKEVVATVFVGAGLTPLHNCRILFVKEMFAIELPGTQLTEDDITSGQAEPIEARQNQPACSYCNDNPRKNCKHCGCKFCGDKKDPEKTILCDECDNAFHIYCLTPPLEKVPEEDEWYCPACKNDTSTIVRVGEKLKVNKKKAKMASASSTSKRDWGSGMACVGRSKVCTIVPSTHYGPIPGIEVGSAWKFRVQVSEAGVHRPHVAGIHGREEDGAYSIVLSGGYEDDADNGDEFYYTGSGGRDLSGNKRTAEQSCDQTLTRMNKALAKNCNAPLDAKKGGDAKQNWKGGKPVRVVRNCKGSKHSTYAPTEGNRYDGIYKIVKYWPEKGKSGFLVWRYLLRRDDPIPAPWTKAGIKRTEQLGLTLQYPEGYLESQKEKEREKEEGSAKKKGKKRKGEETEEETLSKSEAKKPKSIKYEIEAATRKLIDEDTVNKKLWAEAITHTDAGYKTFLDKVEELFLCICCQDVVCKPITFDCGHNMCKSCLQRSFKAEVYSCPACRAELDKGMSQETNKTLIKILNTLFPGYESGR